LTSNLEFFPIVLSCDKNYKKLVPIQKHGTFVCKWKIQLCHMQEVLSTEISISLRGAVHTSFCVLTRPPYSIKISCFGSDVVENTPSCPYSACNQNQLLRMLVELMRTVRGPEVIFLTVILDEVWDAS